MKSNHEVLIRIDSTPNRIDSNRFAGLRGARAPPRGGAAGAPPAPRVPAAPPAPHPSVCVLCQEAVPASHAAACPKNRGLPLPSALFLGARSTAAKQLLEAVAARVPPPPSSGPRAAVRVAGHADHFSQLEGRVRIAGPGRFFEQAHRFAALLVLALVRREP